MAWLSDWAKRRKITIDNTNIDSDLTHFPVPIVLGTSVGQSAQDVTDIFDELGSESLKIAITKADGTTQIYVEIEQWEEVNEKALLWVSKSDLILSSSASTNLYIYFDSSKPDNVDYVGTPGNRTEVWNSDFAAVYTMAQDPSGGTDCIIDSSSNGNHGTPSGMTSDNIVNGQIGKAISFDGSDDYIEMADVVNASTLSLQCCAYPHNISSNYFIISKRDGTYNGVVAIDILSGDARFYFYENDWKVVRTSIDANTWSIITGTYDGSDLKLYIDGTEADTLSYNGSISARSQKYWLGKNQQTGSDEYDGLLSTTRFFTGVLSPAWIKADYHAQTDNLLTFGATEEVVLDPQVSTFGVSDLTTSSAILNGELDDLGGNSSLDVYFEWGATTSYGNTTAMQTMTSVGTFSESITGLTADQTYHCRAAVTDGTSTWYGQDQTFLTIEADDVNTFFMFPF